jgi:hypothetical protein
MRWRGQGTALPVCVSPDEPAIDNEAFAAHELNLDG